jgi:hypothetical protein
MAVKESTGFRNARLNGQSVRKIFEDAVLHVCTGTAPASADDAEIGTLLIVYSKNSGVVSPGEVSTPKEATDLIGSHAVNETFTLTINGTAYTFIAGAAETNITVAAKLAALVDKDPNVEAMASGTATIYIRSKIAGLTFTIAKSGTGTHTLTDDTVANVDADTLNFGVAALGILSKNADPWTGVVIAGGTAGYCRLVKSDDTGVSSSTEPRLQGNAATSGQELTLSSTTFVVGATNTIDVATITEPAS